MLNKRLQKIVTKLQNKEYASVRRDQIRKAIEEGGFDYFIYKGYDEVYNVEPVRLNATIDNIQDHWLSGGKMWANIEGEELEITISYGYSYMELRVNINKVEEVKENIKATNNTDVTVNFNEEKHGIEISFMEKPSEEVRTAMKSVGFRWFRKYEKWIAKQTEESIELVNNLFLKENEVVEEVASTEENNNIDIAEEVETMTKSDNVDLENIEQIETLDKNIFVNCLVPSLNKNNTKIENDKEIEESSYLQKFQIQKIVKLNYKQYNYFINNLLTDYNFLEKLGGWEEDEQGNLLHYYGVAVVCEGMETLIIDPSGCSYARYTCQLVEDINSSLKEELNAINIKTKINNNLYNEAITSIQNNELYEIKVSDKTVINDTRYIKNTSYNGLTVVTGLAIKELINEGKGINILNLKTLTIDLRYFMDGLMKHDNKDIFTLFPTAEDKKLENIKMLDRLQTEMDRLAVA